MIPVDGIENFPLMGRAIFQKAAKRSDFFQKQVIFRSAWARLMVGRSKHVRYDIDGSDMLAYGLHSGSFPGRTIFFATLIMTEYPILGSSTKLREQPMKPTKDLFQGAAIASILLHQQLLSLLILKGFFNREEILEHLDSTLLAAEEMQSNLAAARIGGADELSVPAVRAHLESLRTILEVRHPSTDHDGD